MNRVLSLLLVGALLVSGCASFKHAVVSFPERTEEAFSDPIRRVHLATQATRVMSTASIGITCAALMAPTIVGILVCPVIALLLDYLNFEYILEPLSKDQVRRGEPSFVGPYWETGPRADEGEFFTCGEKPSHTCQPPTGVFNIEAAREGCGGCTSCF